MPSGARLGEPEVSVVKIDVEGAEGWVLAGAAGAAGALAPALSSNGRPLPAAATARLHLNWCGFANRHGYRIFTIPDGIRRRR